MRASQPSFPTASKPCCDEPDRLLCLGLRRRDRHFRSDPMDIDRETPPEGCWLEKGELSTPRLRPIFGYQ